LSTPDRPLRADARRNRERVLAAAREAFAESGFGVPLDAIAARAGVGPGTVYRHFPTKEALFEAVTVARVRVLVALARAGAEAPDPGAALDALLGRIADEAVAKRDLPDALGGVGEAAVAVARGELYEALDVLLDRARAGGAVRAGIGAAELIALLKGLLQAVRESADPELPARLLAVVRDGLRPPPGDAALRR
jgi:AcrR family transcriptional regulator